MTVASMVTTNQPLSVCHNLNCVPASCAHYIHLWCQLVYKLVLVQPQRRSCEDPSQQGWLISEWSATSLSSLITTLFMGNDSLGGKLQVAGK